MFLIVLALGAIGAGYVLALVYWAGLVVLRPLLDLISKRTQPAKGFIPETPTVTSNIAKHADDSSLLVQFYSAKSFNPPIISLEFKPETVGLNLWLAHLQ